MGVVRLTPVVKVDPEKCINCHACISICPAKFCIDGSGEKLEINPDLCIGCGNCITACKRNARELIDETSENRGRVCTAYADMIGRVRKRRFIPRGKPRKAAVGGGCRACPAVMIPFIDDTPRFFSGLKQGVKMVAVAAPSIRN